MAVARRNGWRVAKVEMFIGPARVRRDLFGWMDVLLFDGQDWVGVQACARSGKSAHLRKLRQPSIAEAIEDWLSADNHRAEIWSWWSTPAGTQRRWHYAVTPLG